MVTEKLKALFLIPGGPQQAPTLDASERAFSIGLVTVVLSLVSGLATFLILTGLTPITPRDDIVLGALLINIALIVAMIIILAWQGIGLWKAWKAEVPGARLHVRIVGLFSIIAALPAILLAIAATTTFSRAIDSWFTERTRAIINNSMDVAQSYLEEHGSVIRTDVANMARDVDASADDIVDNPQALRQLLIAQAGLRDLVSAYLVSPNGQLLVTAFNDESEPFASPPPAAIAEAEKGQIAIIKSLERARVAALSRLQRFPGQYLLVTRAVSPKVMSYLQRTEQSVDEYNRLRKARGGLKLAHGLMYTMISMTALLAAIWTGLWFAGRFVAPIRRLIAGARDVSTGNLDVELPERRGEGDLRRLSSTFNTMTRELKNQRNALVTANSELSERTSFIEAVLAGVSSGIIGLDENRCITLISPSALKLLAVAEKDIVGKPIVEALPEFAPIFEHPEEPAIKTKGAAEVRRVVGNDERTFSARVTAEQADGGPVGSVVTFDDISELVAAQRTSAWGDVAQRIAHEIKNPLTPIILSAERIRRKYGKVIVEDRELFEKLTATIERQAGDIKTMVDEFASFARVPKPVMEEGDIRDAVQESVILFREGHPAVTYNLVMPEERVITHFDRRLITQAVTNLVKNATEACESAVQSGQTEKGRVETIIRVTPERIDIDVIDNGIGLPKQNRSRLLEPYVTTKGSKGTGLGLAIVQKITEQHGGALYLDDAPSAPDRTTGALVRITIPRGGRPATHPTATKDHDTNGVPEAEQAPPARATAN
ncbi:MAG: PAS domain-containing sensor histidine kinase [Hyphomicrobium sp.]|nr:PAS domain-containing sensor histidine kinase [Hyphomicrobium sp.]PPD08278.1 MAG: PAS domain-containing sensor histidine kinase [Hyphomicrobium sp.]